MKLADISSGADWIIWVVFVDCLVMIIVSNTICKK